MPTTRRALLLPPMLRALGAWQAEPSPEGGAALVREIAAVAALLDLRLDRLQVSAPPLPELAVEVEPALDPGATDYPLRVPGSDETIGVARIGGDARQAATLVRAVEFAFAAAQSRAAADRAARQLTALDLAVRGISAHLDLERVLTEIVDRVRELADAQYAALGIVDADGVITRFITSGISPEEHRRIGTLPRGRGLLGKIIRENRAYRIPDIGAHPESYGFPPHHPPMTSFLGLPISARGEAIGRLYLTNKQGAAEFSAEDERLVEMFALHAGIAIENARLLEQERRLAIVDERDRISRDLHDSVIQALYGQTLALDDVPELVEEDPAEAGRRVDEAVEAINAVIRDIRNFIFGLRPVLLEGGNLEQGLEHLAAELRRNGAVEVGVSVDGSGEMLDDLPIEQVAELLAVAREALSNVARHADAGRADVRLAITPDEIRLEITDDGRGFDAEREAARGHHGLANMRARSRALGGSFSVASAPRGGTRIIVVIPRRAAGADGGNA
ncbi:MAG TPA: GAF domain-containing sensor histidine kinase [Candidatus Limnocylindria bacterium]|nr:GAF domain-containing sensor histidine kinase [Candidatus Limnocylindria bacterium]